MGVERHLRLHPGLRQESRSSSPHQAGANRQRPFVCQGREIWQERLPGRLVQESGGCAFWRLERIYVAEAWREGGFAQARLLLACPGDSVLGVFWGLRRQGDHRGSIKAEWWRIASRRSLTSSRANNQAARSGRLLLHFNPMIARQLL